MQFRAEEYYRAGSERMRQARELFRSGGSFALAMYCGGLAVECLLRAFRWREDASFEGRHDLQDLFKVSGLLKIDDDFMQRKGWTEAQIRDSRRGLTGAMNEVAVLWHNNLRYASEDGLKAFLRGRGRLAGVKGDPLKKNASDLLTAAQTVVNRGTTLWMSKKKS
jgi:HEPN domain-containing protein